ncbi:SPP1 COMPASS component SPP1 [Candida maltosa Xu316]
MTTHENWDEFNGSRTESPDHSESLSPSKRKKTSPSVPNKKSKQETPINTEETNEDIARQYKKFTNAPKYDYNSEELFCVCRKPDLGEMMVACDGCEEWFHFGCMKVNPNYSDLIASYYCKFCVWKGLGESKWKRKCRLENCYKPIAPGSKYCSKEHGLKFMRNVWSDLRELSTGLVKAVLEYVSDDYTKLERLGSHFPELKVVEEYKKDPNSINDFPDDVKEELQNLKQESNKLVEEIKKQEKLMETLVATKEHIKYLNENLTGAIFSDSKQENQTSKKKKSNKSKKKIDLCYCSKSDSFLIKEIADSDDLFADLLKTIKKRYSEEEDDEDDDDEEDNDWFMENLCIKDKKKCVRHNGWWNLYYDEAVTKLAQLKVKTDELSVKKESTLRNYSMKVYES